MKYFLFTLLLSTTALGYDTNKQAEDDASKAIAQAFYKQSGIESNVNNYVDRYIIPEKHKELLGKIGIVINVVVSGKVEYKWNF